MNIKDNLEALREFAQNQIKENLIGIYIHGSYAMNSYYHAYSDLDLLIIVKSPLSYKLKRQFVEKLITLSKSGPQKGIELSVLLEADLTEIVHPVKFDLHFSNAHLQRYEKDKKYMCENGIDPDLIAHLKVTKERGVVLLGKPVNEVIGEIREEDFINSIMYDLNDVSIETEIDRTYYLLNLLRFRYYLRDGKIYSKVEGGKKALEEFDGDRSAIIENALSNYEPVKYAKNIICEDKIKSFFDALTNEIKSMVEMKCFSDVFKANDTR